MQRFLAFLSSLFILFSIYAQDPALNVENGTLPERYSFEMETSKGFASGILIIKNFGDEIKGSMINEFGVAVLSFTFTPRNDKIKLQDVIGFLNKWYIKRVLKEDIKICLHSLFSIPLKKEPKNYSIQVDSNGTLSVVNLKRNISYSFSTLNIESEQYEPEE